ncbi:hypothetical protein GCM10020358_40910 [Amorphoplanes nipponensis]|uniref:Abortive infection protein n=1 Tax=Actinoplanes nipponensis TaxID=135950 RepID=A0A919JDI6_9ACTN|nr:hypothetical protein [Actinoplanes nipponensis]GIE47395.1 hypothetical protein Ani05nite_09290 [Actinoplanes nipponensis]
MRGKGINYDTGFFPGGRPSRDSFDPDVVRREMRIIAADLHCTDVRVSGGDPERLAVAAGHAAQAGLRVWFSPFPTELTTTRMRPFLAECAERAEQLRAGGADVVFVAGCELTLFAAGLLPGDDVYARIRSLTSPRRHGGPTREGLNRQLNTFLADVAGDVRQRFGGPLTYASGTWEAVDWTPFDIVGVDAYRDLSNLIGFRRSLRRHLRHGKPVAVTEFGCCTYRGAGLRGGTGWTIVDHGTEPPSIRGRHTRSESEQVSYLHRLLKDFAAVGVDAAFWFTFASYQLPHRADPARDLDLAAYGVVKVLDDRPGSTYPGLAWEPKEVFHALAAAYRTGSP